MSKCSMRVNKGSSLVSFPDEYVSIDIETTGLDPTYDQIIEVAAVRFLRGKEVSRFQSLIKINDPLPKFIVDLTGITDDMLSQAPALSAVLPDFLDFVGESVLVGHNVNFDINFIYDNADQMLQRAFCNDFVDTLRISRRLFPDFPSHRLAVLISEFGIGDIVEHRALADCLQTAACFEYMRRYVNDNGIDIAPIKKSYNAMSKTIVPQTTAIDLSHPVYGRVFVFTGTLERMTRKEAMQIVVDLGGICGDGVTAKTNFLVLGNNDFCKAIQGGKSAKHKKAEQLQLKGNDICIISENVFYDMIEE